MAVWSAERGPLYWAADMETLGEEETESEARDRPGANVCSNSIETLHHCLIDHSITTALT